MTSTAMHMPTSIPPQFEKRFNTHMTEAVGKRVDLIVHESDGTDTVALKFAECITSSNHFIPMQLFEMLESPGSIVSISPEADAMAAACIMLFTQSQNGTIHGQITYGTLNRYVSKFAGTMPLTWRAIRFASQYCDGQFSWYEANPVVRAGDRSDRAMRKQVRMMLAVIDPATGIEEGADAAAVAKVKAEAETTAIPEVVITSPIVEIVYKWVRNARLQEGPGSLISSALDIAHAALSFDIDSLAGCIELLPALAITTAAIQVGNMCIQQAPMMPETTGDVSTEAADYCLRSAHAWLFKKELAATHIATTHSVIELFKDSYVELLEVKTTLVAKINAEYARIRAEITSDADFIAGITHDWTQTIAAEQEQARLQMEKLAKFYAENPDATDK
jgi:hypothetical protein